MNLKAAMDSIDWAARASERERCAKHIELIAADWRDSGAMQKFYAAEYLAKQIRELGDLEQGAGGEK